MRRQRAFRSVSACAVAVSLLFGFAFTTTAAEAAAPSSEVPWAAPDGESPYVAAATNQLRAGNLRMASRIATLAEPKLDATLGSELASAISTADLASASDIADALDQDAEATRADTIASANSSVAASSTLTAAEASEPKQAGDGMSTAYSAYYWRLYNNSEQPIYYGSCEVGTSISCTILGEDRGNFWASTFDVGDYGAQWQNQINPYTGTPATLTNSKLRLYRDITNSGDPVIATLACTAGGTQYLDCSGNTKSGNATGDWYYFRLDLTFNIQGHGSATLQIQSRRYQVTSQTQTWLFQAYYYGG